MARFLFSHCCPSYLLYHAFGSGSVYGFAARRHALKTPTTYHPHRHACPCRVTGWRPIALTGVWRGWPGVAGCFLPGKNTAAVLYTYTQPSWQGDMLLPQLPSNLACPFCICFYSLLLLLDTCPFACPGHPMREKIHSLPPLSHHLLSILFSSSLS